MSTAVILSMIGLVYVIWAIVVVVKWVSARQLRDELYPKYIEDGTLKKHVAEEDFAAMFMRVEGPRFSFYLLSAACIVPFVIVIGVRIFNLIWGFFWKRMGELPWFEVGELPHSLMLVFLYVGILFAVAWVTMRTYYVRAPDSFKKEMARLNGETK